MNIKEEGNHPNESDFIDYHTVQKNHKELNDAATDGRSVNNNRKLIREKNDVIEELLKTKAQMNRLYFDCRKNIEQIQILETTKIKNEEMLSQNEQKIQTLLNEKKKLLLQIEAKKENANRCSMLMARLDKADEESKRYKKECEKQKSELISLTRENKQLSAQIKQLRSCGENIQLEIHDYNQSNEIKEKTNKIDQHNDEIYDVEDILDHKIKNKQNYFKIRWKGYDETNDSWEKESNLNCPRILKKYLKTVKK